MSKELIDKIITYNYNEFGNEFGDCIVDMKKKLNAKENIIKEVREYIEHNLIHDTAEHCRKAIIVPEELLQILDKEKQNENI